MYTEWKDIHNADEFLHHFRSLGVERMTHLEMRIRGEVVQIRGEILE